MSKYKELIRTYPFGKTYNPFGKGETMHKGIDFRPSQKDLVWSLLPGRVSIVVNDEDPSMGRFIQIRTDFMGMEFRHNYFHNDRNFKTVGDIVEADDVIAIAGNTGASTGKHIHLEIYTHKNKSKELRELKSAIHFVETDTRVYFEPLLFYSYFYNRIEG